MQVELPGSLRRRMRLAPGGHGARLGVLAAGACSPCSGPPGQRGHEAAAPERQPSRRAAGGARACCSYGATQTTQAAKLKACGAPGPVSHGRDAQTGFETKYKNRRQHARQTWFPRDALDMARRVVGAGQAELSCWGAHADRGSLRCGPQAAGGDWHGAALCHRQPSGRAGEGDPAGGGRVRTLPAHPGQGAPAHWRAPGAGVRSQTG